jgi:hypothetical protein
MVFANQAISDEAVSIPMLAIGLDAGVFLDQVELETMACASIRLETRVGLVFSVGLVLGAKSRWRSGR